MSVKLMGRLPSREESGMGGTLGLLRYTHNRGLLIDPLSARSTKSQMGTTQSLSRSFEGAGATPKHRQRGGGIPAAEREVDGGEAGLRSALS